MERVDSAAALWNAFQVTETTRAPRFDGVPEVLTALEHLPHGIVSLNGRANIERILQVEGLRSHFAIILGHEEVAEQKPAPDGLLHCIENLGQNQPGRFLYIGDHETDSRCAANANQVLRQAGIAVEILMIGVLYGEGGRTEPWRTQPDFEARNTEEILEIVRHLS
jgi:HAD superfamily hydrolase (TIGR01549 family)